MLKSDGKVNDFCKMPKKKKLHKNKLSNKFRFSIFNDTSHEELYTFRANGRVFFLTIVLAIVFVIVLVTVIISYTPLRQLIPGYPSAENRRELVRNAMKLDSLQTEVNLWKSQFSNIQRIVTGKEPAEIETGMLSGADSVSTAAKEHNAASETLLKEEVAKQRELVKKAGETKKQMAEENKKSEKAGRR